MATLALQNRREMTEYLKNSGFNERQVRGLMRAVKDVLSALDLPTRKDWEKLDQRTQKLYDGFEQFRKTFHKRLQKALAEAQKDASASDKNTEKLNEERYSHLLREIEAIRDTAKDLRERWIRDMDALRGDVQRSADESKERDKESKKRDEESKKRDEKLEKESKERDEKLSGDIDTLRGEVQRNADESKERDKESKERDEESKKRDEKLEKESKERDEKLSGDIDTLRGEVQRSADESKKRDEKLSGDIDTLRGEVQRNADESKERDEKIENRNEKRHDQLFQLLVRTQDMVRVQYERGIDQRVSFLERWLLRWFKILRNLWTHLKP